jgi:hypothetical protein
LQDPSKVNGDNVNNVRCGARRHFKDKKREHLIDKINKPAVNTENKNI